MSLQNFSRMIAFSSRLNAISQTRTSFKTAAHMCNLQPLANQKPRNPSTVNNPPNPKPHSSPAMPSLPSVSPPNNEPPRKKLRIRLLSRSMQYISHFIDKLYKRYPTASSVYKTFMMGTVDFFKDTMRYLRLSLKIAVDPQVMRQLSRKEIELLQSMRYDILRVSPLLMVSTLPFANFVIFPLVYKFPRTLLTSHFWTVQQRVEFALQAQKKRLLSQRAVFRALQEKLDSDVVHCEPELHKNLSYVLGQLGSGHHPRYHQVVRCLPLFRSAPYHLNCLVPTHVNALLRLHGMHTLWRRRRRLEDHAYLIHEIDLAIVREGGVDCLSQDEMRSACFLRGLNPIDVKDQDLCLWLSEWVKVSAQVDESSLSLLLHCPIFLAYNKPSNWALFH